MKTLYTVVVGVKDCRYDDYDLTREIEAFSSEELARDFFEKQKRRYTAIAENEHIDVNITMWKHEVGNDAFEGDILDDWFYDFVGEPTDDMVAMVKKPKYYHTCWQIVSGDGHTQRFFDDVPDDITVKLIPRKDLTKKVMKEFGFPDWFIKSYDIDDEFC